MKPDAEDAHARPPGQRADIGERSGAAVVGAVGKQDDGACGDPGLVEHPHRRRHRVVNVRGRSELRLG